MISAANPNPDGKLSVAGCSHQLGFVMAHDFALEHVDGIRSRMWADAMEFEWGVRLACEDAAALDAGLWQVGIRRSEPQMDD